MIGMKIAGTKCKISLRSKCKIHYVTRERDEILDTVQRKIPERVHQKEYGIHGSQF